MDEWGIPPRPHELGGRWGSGGVVQTYLAGQVRNTLTFSDFKKCFLYRPSFQLNPAQGRVSKFHLKQNLTLRLLGEILLIMSTGADVPAPSQTA